MAEETYQQGLQNRDQWDRDLNPDGLAGRNHGDAVPDDLLTADSFKEASQELPELTDADLRQIPVLPEGTRLAQGATYIDLLGSRSEFTAMGSETAGPGNLYVPKTHVDYQIWNRLIGVTNPERLGDADEGATDR